MRYQMEDGTVVDTDNATIYWEEVEDWDGHNRIGRITRSQWHDQLLFRSRKGRYYLVHYSRVQGQTDRAEWISRERAAAWLLVNDHELPQELVATADKISE